MYKHGNLPLRKNKKRCAMAESERFNHIADRPIKRGEVAHAAAHMDIAKLTELLTTSRGDPNDTVEGQGIPALMHLAPRGDEFIDTQKLLLGLGAKINTQSEGGMFTALITAVAWSQTNTVDLLVANGANPFLKDSEGRDALAWAQTEAMADKIRDAMEKYKPYLGSPSSGAPAAEKPPAA